MKTWFSIREAANLAGLKSSHMADYLARSGIVIPSIRTGAGRGRKRLYSFRDVVLLKAMGKLLSQQLPVRKLIEAQEEFKRLHLGKDEMAIATRFLSTDGSKVYYCDNASACIDLTQSGQMAFAFMLDIKAIGNETIEPAQKMIEERNKRRGRSTE